jgi:tRNA1(Val) A37 N6-methylase TrmN6
VAPGPPPAGFQGKPELLPKADEDLCFLCGDFRLFQKLKGHRWSLDDLVTAHLAVSLIQRPPFPTQALDLGCGLGSVLLMLAWKFPSWSVLGVEAQAERAAMARRSIDFNGVADRCAVIEGDLRTVHLERRFSIITGTPPYFPQGTGTKASTEHVAACRFELRGGVESYLESAERHLDTSGAFFVMCAAQRADERVLRWRSSLHARVMRHIVPRTGKDPLLTVWAFSREPAPLVADQLIVRDTTGQWTPAFRAVRATMGLPDAPPFARAAAFSPTARANTAS